MKILEINYKGYVEMMTDCDSIRLEIGQRVAVQSQNYKELVPMLIHSFSLQKVRVASEANPINAVRLVEPHRLAVLPDQRSLATRCKE